MELFFDLAPTNTPSGSVLVAHGFGEHRGRYERFIAKLNEAGYDVWSFDFEGHGTSPGPRAQVDVGRLIRAHLEARQELLEVTRSSNIFLFGHSMGGLITLASTLLSPAHINAVAVTGPALRPQPAVPLAAAKVGAAVGRKFPKLTTVSLDDSLLSRDPQVARDYRADPLVYQGKVPLLTGSTMTLQGWHVLENAGLLARPTLILHGTEDGLANVQGSIEFVAAAGDNAVLVEAPGAFHELLNEPEQDDYAEQIIAWYGRW